MSKFESRYRRLIERIIKNGTQCKNRTGVNAITCFGEDLKFDLRDGFPIVTGKKIFFDKGFHEFKWIMDGGTTTKYLNDHGISWWNSYANDRGELGRTYGWQLRNFNDDKDQLMMAIKEIKAGSRRAHITMWNPSDLNKQVLPCCYTGITFVRIGDELNVSIDFRSSDVFVGLPYDCIFAALLLIDVAKFTELTPALVKLNLNNAHIYVNNIQDVRTYLNNPIYKLPTYDVFTNELLNYKSGPYIETKLNV